MNIKKYISIIISALLLSCAFAAGAEAAEKDIRLFAKGEEIIPPVPIYTDNGEVMVPLRAVCDAFGASCSWEEETEKITVTFEPITVFFQIGSNQMIKYGEPVEMGTAACYSGDYTMVPASAIANAFGYPLSQNEHYRAVFIGDTVNLNVNPMYGTVVTDDYRYNTFLSNTGGISIFTNGTDNFSMELVSVNPNSGYAEAIADIAAGVPEADVYSIVAPTAQEFYAPNNIRTNQTAGITALYDKMLARGLPNLYTVNVVQTLSDHAAEKNYFFTDHHWTQLGAYYAYLEYARENGHIDGLAPLSEYETINKYGYVGSMFGFSEHNPLVQKSPDMLQIFMPKTEYHGAAYCDPYMNSYMYDVSAASSNMTTYSGFISGDNPLEVYKTNIGNGRKLCIIKESFGNAFAVWALNNYEEVYIVDCRMFNGGTYGGFGSGQYSFKIKDFYDLVKFDDLVILNYPVSVTEPDIVAKIRSMA